LTALDMNCGALAHVQPPFGQGNPYSGTDWIVYQIPELGPMRARIARSLPGTPGRVAEPEGFLATSAGAALRATYTVAVGDGQR
jgi:hypothetical protein